MPHKRFYTIAGMTLQVVCDLPLAESTFASNIRQFEARGPGKDNVVFRHHFSFRRRPLCESGEEICRRAPWSLSRGPGWWAYVQQGQPGGAEAISQVVIVDETWRHVDVYSGEGRREEFFRGGLRSLSLMPTDQILLVPLLARRAGCILHASGVSLQGNGLLFAGRAEAGKSTMAGMLREEAEVLCDDRIAVRRHGDDFRIYGTWSHGDFPCVSAASAPLRAVLFLEQADANRLVPLRRRVCVVGKLLGVLVRGFATREWVETMVMLLESIANRVPCYMLQFNRDGGAVELLKQRFGSAGASTPTPRSGEEAKKPGE
jgi:hypothetical protein